MTPTPRREAVNAQKLRTGLVRMRHAFGYSLAGPKPLFVKRRLPRW
jgi:hypothetical protein